jgi:uncharacterized protein YraI
MKRSASFVLLFFLALSASAGSARIIAEKVNVRARPDLSGAGEVVFQANLGEEYAVKTLTESWVGIAAPESCDLWAAKPFVRADGTVGASRLKMRCGPGSNYTVVDIVPRNTQLAVRDDAAAPADWVKVAPTEGAQLWIYREYVEVSDPPAESVVAGTGDLETLPVLEAAAPAETHPALAAADAETAGGEAAPLPRKPRKPRKEAAAADGDQREEPAPKTAKAPARIAPSVPETAGETPPAPADLALIPLDGQGRMTVVEGEVRAAPLLSDVPARYRIVRWEDNKWKVLAHLYGEAAKYRGLQGKKMHVTGRAYWVKNASAPVVVPTEMREAAYE